MLLLMYIVTRLHGIFLMTYVMKLDSGLNLRRVLRIIFSQNYCINLTLQSVVGSSIVHVE